MDQFTGRTETYIALTQEHPNVNLFRHRGTHEQRRRQPVCESNAPGSYDEKNKEPNPQDYCGKRGKSSLPERDNGDFEDKEGIFAALASPFEWFSGRLVDVRERIHDGRRVKFMDMGENKERL